MYLAILFWLHLLGVTLWVGASLLMPLVILPAAQTLEPPARPKFMAALSQRLTPFIAASVVVVIITGILQTDTIFRTYQVLFGAHLVLTVKVVVALLMAANGFYVGVVLARKSAALAPAPGAPPSPEFLRTLRLLNVHSWIQAGMSVIILFLVGLLTAP